MRIPGFTRLIAVPLLLVATTASGAARDGSPQSAVDVALGTGGVIRGRLVDSSGIPLKGHPVSVFYEGRVIAKATTGPQGNFTVHGLQGGSHARATAGNALVCRLWTGDAAPPSARKSVLLVVPDIAVRGQSCEHVRGAQGSQRNRAPVPYQFGSCKPAPRGPCCGKLRYVLQPRALILYAGLGAVIWQASDRDLASPSL